MAEAHGRLGYRRGIESVLKGYPLGLIYFNRNKEHQSPQTELEVLDGQQRITSLGRFIKNKFAVKINGLEQIFDGLNEGLRQKINQTKLLVYICEGEGEHAEEEIKEWFKTINIAGIPLNKQEELNAVFSGPFVSACKEEFSNSQNKSNIQRWESYVKGPANRQMFLATALEWVSNSERVSPQTASAQDPVSAYMSKHRQDKSIDEIKTYFNTVIDWVDGMSTLMHILLFNGQLLSVGNEDLLLHKVQANHLLGNRMLDL